MLKASFASELSEGDSVAVNGVCLTATELRDGTFSADVMNQSLSLTALGALESGVSGEPGAGAACGRSAGRAHRAGPRGLRGRRWPEITPDGFARRIRIDVPGDLRRYLVEHGSVTVDGVSLTVAALTDAGFEVSLIPETLERTTLGIGTNRGTRSIWSST